MPETRAGGSAPIKYGGEVRGAISVGTTDPLRTFGRAELDSLRRLADLGSVALEQAEMRKHLELAVGSGVEALTEAIDMRDHYTWQHSQNVMELGRQAGQADGAGRGRPRGAGIRCAPARRRQGRRPRLRSC